MKPLPHQIEDSSAMLMYEHALLWADPGTGKTVTAMEAIRKGKYNRVVIVCPRIAISMWVDNLKTYLGYKHVLPIRHARALSSKNWHDADALITTPDMAAKFKVIFDCYATGRTHTNQRDYKAETRETVLSVLILDESHMFKSVTAKRTKAMHGNAFNHGPGSICYEFDDVWQLTGTPVTRHADDLFSQLRGVRGDILKYYNVDTYDKWVNEFCTVQYRKFHPRGREQKVVIGSKNLETLNALLDDCKVIKRRLEDVVDLLPPVTYRDIEAAITGKVETIKIDPSTLIRELNTPDSMVAKIRRTLGLGKAKATADYATEYGNRPVLIGYWHTDVKNELVELLGKDYKVAEISGKTPQKLRDSVIEAFNAGTIDYLIGQVSAMGVAINLQEMCSHVILAEELPSPSDFEQFIARVYRRGQKRHVQVDLMRSDHDLDTAIRQLRLNKETVIQDLR